MKEPVPKDAETTAAHERPPRVILCPTDFSELARHAEHFALSLTQGFQSTVMLMHVIDASWVEIGNLVRPPDLRAEALTAFDLEKIALAKSFDISRLRLEVVYGRPHQMIVATARTLRPDLLVMASHGRSGVNRLVLGSVTERTVHHTDVPVMVIPHGACRPERVARTIRQVLVAVDFGTSTAAAVSAGAWLARWCEAELILLHVAAPREKTFSGPSGYWLPEDEAAMLEDKLELVRKGQMKKLLADFGAGAEAELQVREGDAVEEIESALEDTGASVVVMGVHRHGNGELGWIGSTCHKLIRSASVPVLVVKTMRRMSRGASIQSPSRKTRR